MEPPCGDSLNGTRDHYSIYLSDPDSPLGNGLIGVSEYWGTGHIYGDDCSPLPIPDRLWDLVDETRQDLLSGAEFQGQRVKD